MHSRSTDRYDGTLFASGLIRLGFRSYGCTHRMRSTSETHVAGLLRKAQAFNDIGDRSATYKAALLMTLAQLAVEKGHDDGDRFFFAPATLYVVPSIKYDVVADRGGRDRADRDRERPDALVSNKHYNAGCFGPPVDESYFASAHPRRLPYGGG